ncbi:uncharacterized protein K02A2.6-like [Gigantopelta aegis]|uniref:uncharacterized protein K02A2.6-like n=1 Tax=Gigantopelta aegis TaxID=1735272 RepID=UPI001B88C63F|nr:uncharacterized protein K02A2.6-like [Gigantopelta aegis]
MILELQCYRYDIDIIHRPGKDIPVTDCLSRKLIINAKPIKDELAKKADVAVHYLFETLPISDPKLAEIRTCTANDESMQVLKHFIISGWPSQCRECPELILDHWNHRDKLMYADGLIFKSDRIVIPKTLRQEILLQIHAGHFSVEKCHSRACTTLFWPGMISDIEKSVTNCSTCQMHQNMKQKETMISHPIPSLPWQVIASDIFNFDGKEYVLVVDYYSKYPEVDHLSDTRSRTVINNIKES